MKGTALPFAGLFALALSGPAFAQGKTDVVTGGKGRETTVKLQINGGWDVGLAYESGVFHDTAQRVPGGGANANTDDPNAFFNGVLWVDLHAVLQDNIDVHMRIQNSRFIADDVFDPATGAPAAMSSSDLDRINLSNGSSIQEVEVRQLWLRVNQIFDPAVSVTVGLQPATFDVRGRGNAIFMDLGRAESPWGEIGSAWYGPVRNENGAAGIKVAYTRTHFVTEFGWMQITDPLFRDSSALPGGLFLTGQSLQERVAYLFVQFDTDRQGSRVGAIAALLNGTNHGEDVWTFGGAAVYKIGPDIEVFGEFYFQTGTALTGGDTTLDGFTQAGDLDAKGQAWQIGGRVDFPGRNPAWAEIAAIKIGGFEGTEAAGTGLLPGSGETDEFMSYENNDDMLIFDSNEWGLDIDTNIFMIKVKGSVQTGNWTLTAKVAQADAEDDYSVNGEDGLGTELDLEVRYAFNKNAKVYLSVGYLFSSDVLEAFNAESDDSMFVVVLGSEAGF